MTLEAERTSRPIAIVPARGGSKGIPRKNLCLLNGTPLLIHSIEAANQSGLFQRIVVSSDDSEILALAKSFGATAIQRPSSISGDGAHISDAIAHALFDLEAQGVFVDEFILLQPTSPLRRSAHIQLCYERYRVEGRMTAVSVCEAEHHPFKALVEVNGRLTAVRQAVDLESNRQSLPRAYRPNGAIYIARRPHYLENRSFFSESTLFYEMSSADSMDIDTLEDLELAERQFRHLRADG